MKAARAPLRVVMFDPGCFLPYYVHALCTSLRTLGPRVQVIASPPLFEPVDAGDSYHVDEFFFPWLRGALRAMLRHRRRTRQALKAIAYPIGLWRTWRALRVGAPGVIHLQWIPVPVLDRLLVRGLKSRGWRVVYTEHDPLPAPSRPARLRHHCQILRMCDAVIVHTAQQRAEVLRAVPEVTDRIHVIAHGCSRAARANPAERARSRERLGVVRDRPLILFFGLIKPYKGLHYLLDAMPSVIAAVPRALLLAVGEPLMSLDGFERQIDALGLRQHVELRPGFVPAHEVSSYLDAADLLVAPYVSVGASGVVVMAQGRGLPAVVTRVGGLPEFVEPDECGLVVPPRDPDALAKAICRALLDRQALAGMGERAWHRVARDNDWSAVAEQTLALYEAASLGRRIITPDQPVPALSHR